MTGLEKITSRILADAKAQAQEILDEATEKCLSVRAQNLSEAQAAQDRLIAEAEKEGEALVIRAKIQRCYDQTQRRAGCQERNDRARLCTCHAGNL